ncbi:hypothetical protein ACFWBC_40225, partial [Streptomyces sp. NPDC059985]|uniref:hypothetical protein n=1 Tax=Streptomyces sp. NPDC059985 TaxID=3347025 RepID=UPI0036841DE5
FAIHTGNAQTPHTTVNLTPTGETPETLKPPKYTSTQSPISLRTSDIINPADPHTNGLDQEAVQIYIDDAAFGDGDVRFKLIYYRNPRDGNSLITGLHDPNRPSKYLAVSQVKGMYSNDDPVSMLGGAPREMAYISTTNPDQQHVVAILNVDGVSVANAEALTVQARSADAVLDSRSNGSSMTVGGQVCAPNGFFVCEIANPKNGIALFSELNPSSRIGLQFTTRAITSPVQSLDGGRNIGATSLDIGGTKASLTSKNPFSSQDYFSTALVTRGLRVSGTSNVSVG